MVAKQFGWEVRVSPDVSNKIVEEVLDRRIADLRANGTRTKRGGLYVVVGDGNLTREGPFDRSNDYRDPLVTGSSYVIKGWFRYKRPPRRLKS